MSMVAGAELESIKELRLLANKLRREEEELEELLAYDMRVEWVDWGRKQFEGFEELRGSGGDSLKMSGHWGI